MAMPMVMPMTMAKPMAMAMAMAVPLIQLEFTSYQYRFMTSNGLARPH